MGQPPNSPELIEACKSGDRRAFEELVEPQRNRIRDLIASRLNAHIVLGIDVDDVCQETLLRGFTSIKNFQWRGEDSFLRWLGGIAEHVIVDLARKRGRDRRKSLGSDVPASVTSPSQSLRREERFERLEDALKKLKPDHREVITLVRVEGLTFEDAARRMDRSPDAVKQLLYRALKHLRSLFGDTESFHLPDRSLKRSEGEANA